MEKSNPDKSKLSAWAAALESDSISQGRYGLVTRFDGEPERLCCLEVLRRTLPDDLQADSFNETLEDEGFSELGLPVGQRFFTVLNDDENFSFEQIASVIRALLQSE